MDGDTGVRLNAVVDEYIGLLRGLAGALRGAGPSPSEEDQAAMIAQLDPLFAVDKRLQEVIGDIRAEESLCTQMREAHTELAVAESAVQNAHREALEGVKAAQHNLDLCRRRVTVLRGLSAAMASGELTAESIVALASRLALSSGPPRGWTPGAQLHGHRPPCPTEDMMRCGALFRRMNLGETGHPGPELVLETHEQAPGSAQPNANGQAHSGAAPRRSRRRRSSAGTGTDTRSDAEAFLDLDLNPGL